MDHVVIVRSAFQRVSKLALYQGILSQRIPCVLNEDAGALLAKQVMGLKGRVFI